MATRPEGTEPELRDYARSLWRRKWVVASATLVVTLAAVAVTVVQTPVYRARSVLLLRPKQSATVFDPSAGFRNDPQRDVDTEIQVLKSQPVSDAVRRQFGVEPQVSVSAIGQTDTVAVVASDSVPQQAARVANAYAQAYLDFRQNQNINTLLAEGTQLQSKIRDLQTQIDNLDRQIGAEPPAQRASATDPLAVQERALVDQQSVLNQRLQELQVEEGSLSSEAELITPATTPTTPSSPRPVRNGIIAVVIGLLFGVSLAFLVDYIDDSVKTRDDLERVVPTMQVLGLIPTVPGWKDASDAIVISESDPRSEAAESYRALRTSIQFMGLDRPMRTLQITSANISEGKSTTLANLAVALSRAGQKVIVVCCDLRRPRLHRFFGLDNEVGFTSVLLGDVPLSAALQDVPGEERLQLLASGPIPPNPSELLSGRRTVEVLTALQTEADIVLIDSPPVLPVSDAAVLSARVDAVVLVASAGRTTRRSLRRTLATLDQVAAPVVGLVLNRASGENAYVYQYGYQYSNGSTSNGKTSTATTGAVPESTALN